MTRILLLLSVLIGIFTIYQVWRDADNERRAAQLEFALLHEPDPLTVERIAGDDKVSTCVNREYEFRRLVKSTKELDIFVQERWYSLDGNLNVGKTEGEIVFSSPVHYPLDAGFDKVMTFQKRVPESIPKGLWEYRPYATYMVNEKKRITRPLPSQIVEVDCDFRGSK
jgi:hypothetical protein